MFAKPVFAIFLTVAPLPAMAAEPAGGRFVLQKSENGFVRLDTQTGAMALCQEKDGSLVCRMGADERAAYDTELDRLAQRVAALEKRAGQSVPSGALRNDAEVERSLSIMEQFMRRFMGLVEDMQRQDNASPLPGNRT